MTTQQSYALYLADELELGTFVPNVLQNEAALRQRAAAELRRQHTRITELESQLAQRFDAADMATAAAQGFRDGATAPAQPVAEPAIADSVLEDAARWREHVGKLDALVAYCPTCCQGFIAKQDMTRDEVLFACGKAVGQSGAKRLREALDLAVDHIDMDALRISHCKDAAVIDAARKQGEKQ